MHVKLIPLAEIKPYDKNPRVHGDVQIKRIAQSIEQFGWTQPLVLDDNNTILAGHGRYAAALQLGAGEAPCINVKDLSEAEKKAYRIVDNKLVTDSIWDDELLQVELNDLVNLEYELNDFGLDDLLHTPQDDDDEKDVTDAEEENGHAVYTVVCDERYTQELERLLKDSDIVGLAFMRKLG